MEELNLIDRINGDLSRINSDIIANWIGNDKEKFRELINLLFNTEPAIQMRVSWIISIISDTNPGLLKPYIDKIVSKIATFKHPGTRRNLLRYLANIDIPEKYFGKLYDTCLKWLLSKNEPPAVKVYSMQILYNISEVHPDLKREIVLIIEELTNHESAAIKSRSNQLLKRINL